MQIASSSLLIVEIAGGRKSLALYKVCVKKKNHHQGLCVRTPKGPLRSRQPCPGSVGPVAHCGLINTSLISGDREMLPEVGSQVWVPSNTNNFLSFFLSFLLYCHSFFPISFLSSLSLAVCAYHYCCCFLYFSIYCSTHR